MLRSLLLIGLFLAMCSPVKLEALELRQVRWGYDGAVVPERFNLLSVLVENNARTPFEGTVLLEERRGLASRVGAPYSQSVYVSPNTSRWIQFMPFVLNDGEWVLKWGPRTDQSATIDEPRMGPPGRVFLIDPTALSIGAVQIKTFPTDLFPPTVSATEGLHSMVMDHAPKWEPTRRAAFLDWLHRGGVVHLLRDSSGPVVFDGELAFINDIKGTQRVGAGKVIRHDVQRGEVNDEWLTKAGFPLPELKQGGNVRVYGFDSSVLQSLAQMAKPKIAWWLIYMLTMAYIVVIGPAHYRWGRKLDFRLSIGAFLAIVGVFSLAFSIVGRRGVGEVQSSSSISFARALGDGSRYDVMQWVNAFVTDGDEYLLTHKATDKAAMNLYATASEFDAVNGHIVSGRDGYFEVDIPLYSSRGFVHRAVMTGHEIAIDVKDWNGHDSLTKFALAPSAKLPEGVIDVWLRAYDRIYPVRLIDGLWQAQIHEGENLSEFFAVDKMHFYRSFASEGTEGGASQSEEWIKNMVRVFLGRALGGTDAFRQYVSIQALERDHAQLVILARSPEGFRMHGEGFKHEKGWVFYIQDVFRSPGPEQLVEKP